MFSPETGFGFIPRMGPMQLVPASEAMKIGMLPVQTPEVLVSVMGQKAADDLYGTFQDWLFGEQGSFSEQPFSWDLIIPAWAQKQVSNMDKMSRAWGTKFTVLYAREMNKFNSGQREFAPTTEELTKMVSNSFWFDTLGNLGVPTPQTPYPILTRPGVYNGEMDIPRLIRGYIDKEKEDPTFDAGTAFQDNFGYYFSSFGNMRGTVNTGGIAPQNIAVADATRFNELIGDIAGEIAEEHLGVLGIITNNRIEQGDYDRNAATWQKVNRVPGKGIKWKEDLSAEERILEGERIAGWVYYRSRMDALEAELFSRGLSSFQQVEARDLKVKKDLLIEDMEDRPFMRGWVIDYQDAGGGKTKAAVQTIRMALADPDFEKFMIDNNMDKTLSAMQQYVTARNYFGNAILELNAAAPNSDKYKQEKLMLKLQWLMKKDQLRMYDERWAEIEDLYLSADEDPAVETALNSKLLREELQGG